MSALHRFETNKQEAQLSTKTTFFGSGIGNDDKRNKEFFLLDLANILAEFLRNLESRPTSRHAMTASPSVQNAIFWQSVCQKGRDWTRRTIDHTVDQEALDLIFKFLKLEETVLLSER